MDIQARIPAALCALHNLVNRFDPEEYEHPEFDWVLTWLDESDGIPTIDDHEEPVVQEGNETVRANHQRDMIAQSMWAVKRQQSVWVAAPSDEVHSTQELLEVWQGSQGLGRLEEIGRVEVFSHSRTELKHIQRKEGDCLVS